MPAAEATLVLIDVPLTLVVEVLLSSEKPMAVIACPLHRVPVAERAKGVGTVAPSSGALTVTLVVELEDAFSTTRLTSVVHEAPPAPHDLTCRTWLPVAAVTLPDKEAPLTMLVLELSSSE